MKALPAATKRRARPERRVPSRAPRRLWIAALWIAASVGDAQARRGGGSGDAPGDAATDDGGADAAEDIVEIIDDGSADAARAAEAGPPPSATLSADAAPVERIQVRGWARAQLAVALERTGPDPAAPNPFAVPRDRLVLREQLHLRSRYERADRFEVVVSALLGHSTYETDAPPDVPFYGWNGQSSRTAFEASLREAYVGVFAPKLDFRLGQQRIAWGKGDAFAPNDVINPRDLRDPMLAETEILRIPTMAVRVDVDLDFAGLQFVWTPFFVPHRYDVYGSNWGLLQDDAPAQYKGLLNLTRSLNDGTLYEALAPLLAETQRPPDDLTNGSGGLRVTWTAGGVDVSHYVHYGSDGLPETRLAPEFQMELARANFAMPTETTLVPFLEQLQKGIRPVLSSYPRRYHVGSDLETAIDRFVLRIDAAYDSQMVFTRLDDFTSIRRPAVQAVAAVEYQPGELDRVVLVEGWAMRLLSPADVPILGFAPDGSAALAGLFRWTFLRERLEVEARAVLGLRPRSYALRPQLAWKKGAFQLRIGALLLGGDEGSTPDYYARNTGAYMITRFAF